MISSAMADDLQVKSILSSTADVWLPIIMLMKDENLPEQAVRITFRKKILSRTNLINVKSFYFQLFF
jgi:hypothetical protein